MKRLHLKTKGVCALLLFLPAIQFFAIGPVSVDEVLISRQIETTRIEAVVAFASALQMVDGAFVLSLEGPRSQASTAFSQGIVEMLFLLGRLPAIDKASLLTYVAQCQLGSGGFVSTTYEATSPHSTPTMLQTLYAVEILATLSFSSTSIREAAVSWVLDCYRSDGGFDEGPERPSTFLWSTRRAVRILCLLDALGRIDKSKTAAFVKAHQNTDHGFGMVLGDSSSYLGTYEAVMALKYLGELSGISQGDVADFLMQDYDPEAGIFGAGLLDQKGHLELLGALGAIGRVNSTKMKEFVLSCQSGIHGGFVMSPDDVNIPNRQHGDECFYAVKVLSLFGDLALLNAPFLIQNAPVWTGEDDLATTTTDGGTTPSYPPLPAETMILFAMAAVLVGTFVGTLLLISLGPKSRRTKRVKYRRKTHRIPRCQVLEQT
jgi:prenyltransferase beta subunit